MSEFTLTPDEPDLPTSPKTVRLVATGLHPTAAVPTSKRTGQDQPPAYAVCAACGQMTLLGTLRDGTRLALDVAVQTYTVVWTADTAPHRLELSRSSPPALVSATGAGAAGRRDVGIDAVNIDPGNEVMT
jgi:hypothetical protein